VTTQRRKIDGAVKKKPLSWDDLLTLSTLARHQTYQHTARELGLTRSTVVRRIQRLELALGFQVVEEHQGKVTLTAQSAQVVSTARGMNDMVAQLERQQPADGEAVHGLVRITAPEGIAAHLLAPAFANLHQRHPGLELTLLATSAVLSISHKQADLAVRMSYPEDGNLIAIPAATLRYRLYRSRTALDNSAQPLLVSYDDAGVDYPESAALRQRYPELKAQFRSNNLAAQIQAVRNGGIGLLPEYVERHYHDLTPLEEKATLEKTMYIVFHSMHRDHPKIRAVAEWIKDSLA
jgi:DNA-binding transcriptional LysR family regulator